MTCMVYTVLHMGLCVIMIIIRPLLPIKKSHNKTNFSTDLDEKLLYNKVKQFLYGQSFKSAIRRNYPTLVSILTYHLL